MQLGLDGKIAVVTGASKGIGYAVTEALVAEGATVVAGARTPGRLAELSTERVTFVPVDLTTSSGPAELVAAAAALGGIDIVINNAGALTPRTDGFASITDQDWDRTFSLNLMAAVRTTRAALPELVRRGGGSIVVISSVNAYLPDPLVMDYSAAKAALSNWAKSLSKHLGPRHIRVNTISPGPVATDLWLGDRKSDRERQQNPDQGLDDDHPNGKRNPPLTRPQHPPHRATVSSGWAADDLRSRDSVPVPGSPTTATLLSGVGARSRQSCPIT